MELKQPPTLQEANLDAEDLKMIQDTLTDSYALATVNQTFHRYENYRTNNHDRRWTNADGLYTAWVPTKVWEGTTIPRASLGVPLVFYHIGAMLPALIAAVFANGNDDWFQAEAPNGVDPQVARMQQAVLRYAIEEAQVESGKTGRLGVQLALHNLLQYGNGFVHLEIDPETNLPIPHWLDIRDVYVDPECQTPNVDDARAVIIRRTIPIDALENLGKMNPSLKIPSRSVLAYLSQNTPIAQGDTTKQISEAVRGVSYSPSEQRFAAVPSQRPVEILIYYTKDRIIWCLNRSWIALNMANPYRFIPVCSAPCYVYTGRFYAMGVADVQEGYQRYVEDLLNKRLDQLSLSITPPRVYKRGAYMTPAQMRWYPGAGYGLENPDTDMSLLTPQGADTSEVYRDIQYIEMLSEKTDGVSSLGLGVPRPGNINRTKGGVDAQLRGGEGRLSYILDNVENYLIVPMLYKMQRMVQLHKSENQNFPGVEGRERIASSVPAQAFNFPAKFRILASSRVRTRQEIGSMFPFLTQYLLSGPFMSELAKTGKTVNFEELIQMLQDATGVGRIYQLIRPMNEQEQQALQQPPPEVALQMQMKQMEQQTRVQMGQMAQESDMAEVQASLQREMIKKQPNEGEMQALLMKLGVEQALAELKLTTEQQKALIEAARGEQKLRLDREKMNMERVKSQQEMTLAGLTADMDLRKQAQQSEMDLQTSAAKTRLEQYKAAQGMKKTRAEGRTKPETSDKKGKAKK